MFLFEKCRETKTRIVQYINLLLKKKLLRRNVVGQKPGAFQCIILLFVVILREPEGNNMFIGLRIFMRKQPT